VRVSQDERVLWEAEAQRLRLTLSGWIRRQCNGVEYRVKGGGAEPARDATTIIEARREEGVAAAAPSSAPQHNGPVRASSRREIFEGLKARLGEPARICTRHKRLHCLEPACGETP